MISETKTSEHKFGKIILCGRVLGGLGPGQHYMFNWIFTLMIRYFVKRETGLPVMGNLHNVKLYNQNMLKLHFYSNILRKLFFLSDELGAYKT